MPVVETRPGKLDVDIYPGNAVALELDWSDSPLASRTFEASVAGTFTAPVDGELDVSIVGDVMTIVFAAEQTAQLVNQRPRWTLTETTSNDQVRISGRLLVSTSPINGTQTASVVVAVDTASVTVSVLGEPGPTGPGSTTDLAFTASPTDGTVTSSTGTDATVPVADGTNAGLMAPAEHSKLAGIEAGAQVNEVSQAELDAEAAARAAADALLIPLTQKGAANGVATLDGSTLIPDVQIPSTIARDTETTNAIAAEAVARDAAIAAAIAALVASAPGVLDTLDEIAAALGDDANFAATMTAALAGKQPLDAELTAWAALTSAANKLGYFTGSGAAAVTDFTAFARTLLDDPDGPTMRATLGLVIGTNVQAWNANLDTLAAGGSGATALLASLLNATYVASDPAQPRKIYVSDTAPLDSVGNNGDIWIPSLPTDQAGFLLLTGGILTGDLSVPDEVYDATGWNGSLEVPTKNAVRDKFETLRVGTDVEAHDTDLTTIAGLTPTNDDVLQRKAGAWTNRTPAQVKTDLAIAEADVSGLVADLALKAPLASPTFTGTPTAPDFAVSGLTGATTATRYVGGTASGPPTSGTFTTGDFVVTTNGNVWVCTAGGTPGTWTPVGVTSFVRKTSNETVNNSSTTQADDQLTLAVVANATYLLDMYLVYSVTSTADLKLDWTIPASATMLWTPGGPGSTTSAAGTANTNLVASDATTARTLGGIGAGSQLGARPTGLLVVAGTAGNMALNWAQSAAESSDCVVYANSWMRLTRVA